MAKNYGQRLGSVSFRRAGIETCGKAVMDVMYKDDLVLVLRDWPNTPRPSYFLVARTLNDAAWVTALRYMSTINTGGIECKVLNYHNLVNFDAVLASFITPQQEQLLNQQLIAEYEAFKAQKIAERQQQ